MKIPLANLVMYYKLVKTIKTFQTRYYESFIFSVMFKEIGSFLINKHYAYSWTLQVKNK